jgi:hypothetical protein
MSRRSHETYEVGTISAREGGELVIRLCHLDIAFDVRGGESVDSVFVFEVVHVAVVIVSGEEVFGGSERIETRGSFISVGGGGSIRGAEIIARQRVSV